MDRRPESRSRAPVLYCEFSSPALPPLPKTKSLASVIARFEADPARAAHLRRARQDLGRQFSGSSRQSPRALRLAAGLSQTQLAERIGTVQSHVARIEAGQNDPGTDLIVRLAAALHVEPEVVFSAVRKVRESGGADHDE